MDESLNHRDQRQCREYPEDYRKDRAEDEAGDHEYQALRSFHDSDVAVEAEALGAGLDVGNEIGEHERYQRESCDPAIVYLLDPRRHAVEPGHREEEES